MMPLPAINPTFSLILLLFSLISLLYFSAAAAPVPNPSATFIRASCRATTYPVVCVQSLSTYAGAIRRDPKQLVETALAVSAERAKNTRTFVYKLTKFRGLKSREYAAIRDCLEQISDSVDRLTQSIGELKKMGGARGPDFTWHLSNLQTWVSAALTDASTCADGFSGRALNGRIKFSIRRRMTHVSQVTSNALALCNKFAGHY